MITLDEFLKKYLGNTWGYPDTLYLGECLSIVKRYIKECFGISPPSSGTGSAYGYWTNFPSPLGTVFEKVENTSDLIPQKGWIALWKPWEGNPHGHISIVADGSTTGTLKNWAANWTSKTFQLESNRYTNVVGFLKPKLLVNDDMTDEQKRILDFIGDRTEGDVREAFGALIDSPNKDKTIQTLQEKVLSLDKFVRELQDRVVALESDLSANLKLVEDWQRDVKTANKSLQTAEESLILMTTEKNQYKKWYESKLDEIKKLDSMTALQHIFYGVKKLLIK